ncbi:MAG: hypothetical protein ACK4YL_16235, partial [Microcystis sp.]|uniref:hypothetical protein n=1 Tax=Microcystis sp. TaxID=1127 RepID=UPI00391A8C09
RPVGAKHSGNNLSVKPEIFYPNASPLLFAANPIYILTFNHDTNTHPLSGMSDTFSYFLAELSPLACSSSRLG